MNKRYLWTVTYKPAPRKSQRTGILGLLRAEFNWFGPGEISIATKTSSYLEAGLRAERLIKQHSKQVQRIEKIEWVGEVFV